MIHYLVTPGYSHTMETFLDHWAGGLKPRVRIVTYDEALRAERLPRGTYVFSDLERLLPAEMEIATRVWEQLHAAGMRILNHPRRTLRRYDLLRTLHDQGRNSFRVVRASDRGAEIEFPVFLREEGEHSGSLTKLIRTRRELDQALAGAMFRGHRPGDLLVVEYYDTADENGVFRKYSSFMVGGTVVPCHIDCSKGWIVKDTDIVNEQVMAQERDYLATNPHRPWLEETFRIAGVDYGRIDYSLDRAGKPQVWEINTNPVVILHPKFYTEIHTPVKREFAARIIPALEAVDTPGVGDDIAIEIPVPLLTRLDFEKKRQLWVHRHRSLVRHTKRNPVVRAVRSVVRPVVLAALSPFLARVGRGGKS